MDGVGVRNRASCNVHDERTFVQHVSTDLTRYANAIESEQGGSGRAERQNNDGGLLVLVAMSSFRDSGVCCRIVQYTA